ncbi:phosphoketolase family protein [Eoetvoesiella caeni]|uniref:Probable phosphoketolase n=1 Tax=Eoetvoesiella caeni TaxID=645616 RepID=A0A366HIX9_9BURK|nr:phosphoketolase family protein [Eoetvoesiella caeni]MCI2807684.1 phosphoketolase family protein [Eoetvoesiella caeni]NYT52921.1 phosphoketolase family protein [Eoetvoesiella caeni]RBP42898.1 xylulose-5-phosphate/fructose-6-phosphate phosphoketolase [Eoetvoesiella caeni]
MRSTQNIRAAEASRTLSDNERRLIDAYWRACNYLCAGMIYLRDNPLLKEPLRPEHFKNRLLGHWGSDPGQTFIWVHLNRVIRKFDLNMIYLSGPGHGAPAVISNCYLEKTYSEIYPEKSRDEAGMLNLFRAFSFPGQLGSHCTPEVPGSIHEGGELGYSVSHAFGAVFDNPDLIASVVVGDGEAETGPLATSWHSNKFLNPIRDGAVLPILHMNGYKIANPTLLARITPQELEDLFKGYGWTPHVVEGEEPDAMHEKMASTVEACVLQIRAIQEQARKANKPDRPRWPMIILRSPKGWTGPKEVDGHQVENFWRSHQVPVTEVKSNPEHLRIVEQWMRSYRPQELFDEHGALMPELQDLAPVGERRMSANPHANGGKLRKPLAIPDFRDYAVPLDSPGSKRVSPTENLGRFLRDVMKSNMTSFRLFSPDENASNRLQEVYKASPKTWMAQIKPEDADGTEIAPDGRVMEMLSEHTLEGWLEGYLLTGRHGIFNTYEAFVHIVDSMYNQHAKWLDKAKLEVRWRAPISSLNILISSLVWRQDHNGFTHQDPGFLDLVSNKSAEITRIYLPPDANCLLSVADHCLRSTDYVNVIVSDKQPHLVYLDMEAAAIHCAKGIGIWEWASTDAADEPDVVMASAGDILTQEALAAVAILREHLPKLKIRFVNVVDLYRLQPSTEHPHGLSDRDFDALFTRDKPVIFNFHGYPWLIHKFTYRRTNHSNIHVRGYKEKGNINTPLELAIQNQVDRFNLAIDVIDRVPGLRNSGAHLKEWLKGQIIDSINHANTEGTDRDEIQHWKWPQG